MRLNTVLVDRDSRKMVQVDPLFRSTLVSNYAGAAQIRTGDSKGATPQSVIADVEARRLVEKDPVPIPRIDIVTCNLEVLGITDANTIARY